MKKIIESLGMNIKDFSKYYGIPYNTVRQWWNGDRTPPKWVTKILNESIELKKNGEQIAIEDRIIFCNIKTASRLNGEYRTYYTNEEEANKEIEFYNKNNHSYQFKREIYKRIN